MCFKLAQDTPDNRRMWAEIESAVQALPNDERRYNGYRLPPLSVWDVATYNHDHMPARLVCRSIRQLHKAVVHGDHDNGLLAQAYNHRAGDCAKCRAAARKE